MEPDEGKIFLSIEGGPFYLDRMSKLVRDYVEPANLGKSGRVPHVATRAILVMLQPFLCLAECFYLSAVNGSSSIGALAIARETWSSMASSRPTTAESWFGGRRSISS